MAQAETLIGSIAGRVQRWAQASLGTSIDPSQQYTAEELALFFRTGGATGSGVSISETTAMKVASYYRCCNIVAGSLSNMSADLVMRESETVRRPAVGHSLRRVLTVKPNQWQTPVEFKKLMQLWLLQRGNAYARKVMLGRDVIGLIPLHPRRVFVEQLDSGQMRYTYSPKNGKTEYLTSADIMHLRGLSVDGVVGLPVLHYMSEALGIATSAEYAAGRMMNTGAMGGAMVQVPGKMGDAAYNRLQEQLKNKHSGTSNAGAWMILEDGAEAKAMALSPQELQFLEVRDFQRYDIATFLGVPPFMIGATEKSTSFGSGFEQQGQAYLTYTVLDWVKIWEEAIKRDLLRESEWERYDWRFYTNSLARADLKSRTASYIAGLQYGYLSPDEVRAFEDMNPRPDGGGAVFYDPPNQAGGAGGDVALATAPEISDSGAQ